MASAGRFPSRTSGAMYAAVPIGPIVSSLERGTVCLAIPKSASLSSPSVAWSRLLGLTSRCTMPAPCIVASAQATWTPTSATRWASSRRGYPSSTARDVEQPLHRDPWLTIDLTPVEDRHDVSVLSQPTHDLELSGEASAHVRVSGSVEHLHGHPLPRPDPLPGVHDAVRPGPDRLAEPIPVDLGAPNDAGRHEASVIHRSGLPAPFDRAARHAAQASREARPQRRLTIPVEIT